MGDRLKKSLPEKYQKRTETSILTAVLSASLATLTCYPLDTVRRQMQLRGTPYTTVLEAFAGEDYSCLLFKNLVCVLYYCVSKSRSFPVKIN
jgi:hypothetical protein